MSVEPAAGLGAGVATPDERSLRQVRTTELWTGFATLVIAAGFILICGGRQDLGPIEARLGLAASEPYGPLGIAFGGWEPSLWPGQVGVSQLWAWGENGRPTSASVRWPAAIAGLLTGLVLARRALKTLGLSAALFVTLCWSGSVALIDRSAGTGLDLITGLAVVAALDRMLGRGSDWVAGLWAGLAFLCGGWPPVALIMMATVVLGRRGAGLTVGLLTPPIVAAAAWSVWALNAMPAEAWAAALTLPLTQKSQWLLPLGVVLLGLPWSPFAALAASRAVRDSWSEPGRRLVLGWLQIAGACLLAGTVVPGLAGAAGAPALAGLAVCAAACCDRVWNLRGSAATAAGVDAADRNVVRLATAIALVWVVAVVVGGIYLAAAVSYYRTISIVLVAAAAPILFLAWRAVELADSRRALAAVALVAICLKTVHTGIYAPEWNYRLSQGPWGRAIGQWIPPNWPLYVTNEWSPDLAFSISRQVRLLASPKQLEFLKGDNPNHVLLVESEFENWPSDAPALVKVASFQDQSGGTRVLARTEGEFSWRVARRGPAPAE